MLCVSLSAATTAGEKGRDVLRKVPRYGITAEFEVRKEVRVKWKKARFSQHMHLHHTCTHTYCGREHMHLDGSDLRFTSTPALTRGPSSRPCWDPPMLLEAAFPFWDILAKRPLTSSFSSSHPSPFPHTSHLTSCLAPYTCPVFNSSLTNQTNAVTAFFSDKTCNLYLLEFLLAPFHHSSPLLTPVP